MPPQEINADPAEVARLAKEVLDVATTFASSANDQLFGLAVPQNAFGNTTASTGTYTTVTAAVEGTDTVVGQLVEVLEGDGDRLYQVAAAYQRADQDAAARACAARSMSPYPC